MFKKLALVLLSSLLFLNSMYLPISAFAQSGNGSSFGVNNTPATATKSEVSPWYAQSIFEWIPKVYDTTNPSEIFGERYTAAQTQWVLWGVSTAWVTFLPGPAKKVVVCAFGAFGGSVTSDACAPELDEFYTWFEQTTADSSSPDLASKHPVLDSINSNPISGVGYVKNVIAKFNPVTEVNAQGFGFTTGANSIKTLWQATRNISYSLIVLAVIVMAFMIMFRIKMSPQLVISVQSALPNIIFTTILITFSYAIAGFVIDLMYVSIGLIAGLLVSNGFTGHTFTEMFNQLNLSHSAFALMYAYWINFLISSIVALIANIGSFVMGIFLVFFALLSILAVLWWSIKIIYVLLKNFAMVVLTIATGPLEILMGAFTGKSTFGGWLRKLISHLAVYPLMGLIFFFSFFFLTQGSKTGSTVARGMPFDPVTNGIANNTWFPPFSGSTDGTADHGALADNILWVVVSFVIFSNATKVVEIIQGLITGKGFAYGTGIGEALGTVKTVAGMGVGYKSEEAEMNYKLHPGSVASQRQYQIWSGVKSVLSSFR